MSWVPSRNARGRAGPGSGPRAFPGRVPRASVILSGWRPGVGGAGMNRSHLPEEPNSFIGRERELEEVRGLACSARVLTLCGPGGMGAFLLAVAPLSLLAADFPDGAWLVELADLPQS